MDLNTHIKRRDLLIVAVLFIFIFLLNLKKVYNPDVFYHLKMGEIVSKTGGAVNTEQFSFIKKGLRIIHHEWLGDLILYKIYSITGYAGLSIFKTLIVAISFLLLFLCMIKIYGHIIMMSLFFILYAFSLQFIAVEKPVIFTIFFIAFLITILHSKSKYLIFFLPPLFLLWANVHPGFLFGLLYYLTFIIGYFYDSLRERNLDIKKFLLYFIIFLIASGFTLLTPYGYRLFLKIYEQRAISEFLIMDELNMLRILQLHVPFILGLFLLILVFYNIKHLKLKNLMPFFFFTAIALLSANAIAIFLYISIPSLAEIININLEKNRVIIEQISKSLFTKFLSVIISAVFVISILFVKYPEYITGLYGTGKLNLYYPENAIRFIKEHNLSGKWFNSIEFGGAIVMEGTPEMLPFVYTGNNFLKDIIDNYYKKFLNEPSAMKEFIENNQITGVILTLSNDKFSQHFQTLRDSFALVYWDDISVVLVNKNLVDMNFIRDFSLMEINPYTIFNYLNSDAPINDILRKEIISSVNREPCSSKTHLIYGLLLLREEKYVEAEKELKESIRIDPVNLPASILLEMLYKKTGRVDEATHFGKKVEFLKKIYKKSY